MPYSNSRRDPQDLADRTNISKGFAIEARL
jgi:hypothetical protein